MKREKKQKFNATVCIFRLFGLELPLDDDDDDDNDNINDADDGL